MGFIKSLFGINSSGNEKIELHDPQLGTFSALINDESRFIWKGTTNFLNDTVILFINGDKKQLDSSEKNAVQDILNNEKTVESEITRSLKEQFENADKDFVNWEAHFRCVSISSAAGDINISMEEDETYDTFNIRFIGTKATDVNIDS